MARKSGSFDRVWILLLSMLIAALGLAAFHGLRPAAARRSSAVSQLPEETYLPFVPRSAVNSPFEFVAGIGGSIRASAISGTLTLVGEGAALAVLEVGDPAAPVRLARLELPGLVNGLQKINEIVYLATEYGLAVVDVQDPVNPQALSYFPVSTGAAAIYVDGPHAFLAAREAGLVILDVSDPARPMFRGQYPEPANAVWVSQDLAYLITGTCCTGNGALQILDVTDPAVPVLVGGYSAEDLQAVQVVDTLAYVLHANGLMILDVTDPASPTLHGSYELFSAGGMRIVGEYAYLVQLQPEFSTLHSCIFWVLDVSDPGQPAQLGQVTRATPDECSGEIQAGSERAYVASGALHILDVATPTLPTQVGMYSRVPRAVRVSGPLAYLADPELGLAILEVSDPHAPDLRSVYPVDGDIWDVQVQGERVYLMTRKPSHPFLPTFSFDILDVSDPDHPGALSSRSIGAWSSVIEGDRAYLHAFWRAGFDAHLTILDISDPLSPTTILTYDPIGPGLQALDAVGHTAYLVFRDPNNMARWELRILDTSDPSNPILEGSVPISRSVDLAVVGSLVFSASPEAGLQIVDASDPSHPVLISTFEVPGTAASVHPVRSAVYLADGDLQWIDLTDPANPVLIGTFPTIGATASVQAVADRVYVADAEAGIHVLRPR